MVKEVKREFYEERQVQPMIGEGFIRDDTVDGQNAASQLFIVKLWMEGAVFGHDAVWSKDCQVWRGNPTTMASAQAVQNGTVDDPAFG